jgi:type IV secretion system protein VirB1
VILLAGLIYSAGFLSQCGPTVAPTTTQAIIQVESGGNPLAIGDNNLRRSFSPGSKREAVSLATQLIAQGHSVDLGLMQINSQHLASMGLTLDEVFDPCRNVRAGTAILADFYRRYPNEDPGCTLYNALSAYNTGQAWKGAGYVNRVLAAAGVKYRVRFVPVEDQGLAGNPIKSADAVAPAREKKRNRKAKSAASPFFFRNTSSSLAVRKGSF